MNRILNLFLNPFVISLPIALVVILLLPSFFDRYKVELVKQKMTRIDQNYFHDLNHDSLSESITLSYERENLTDPCLKCWTDLFVSGDRTFIQQYNSPKRWLPKHDLMFGDFDKDNIEEVYFFEYSSDSLFLKGIDPMGTGKIIVDDFIAKVKIT
nr:hypothetical protein [Bacteroidota bacterium]